LECFIGNTTSGATLEDVCSVPFKPVATGIDAVPRTGGVKKKNLFVPEIQIFVMCTQKKI
jgi:hypothetical protein